MSDVKATCETIAALLARSGVAARAIKNQATEWAVEARLGDNRVLWGEDRQRGGWVYSYVGKSGGIEDYGAISQDTIGDPTPERIAFIVANFPYGGELDADGAKQIVSDLLSQVADLTDEEREAILSEAIADEPERSVTMSWLEFRDSGLLWAVNRYVLHPRGLSLVFRYDESGDPTGWAMLGDGTEPMAPIPGWDVGGFSKFEAFIDGLKASGEGS